MAEEQEGGGVGRGGTAHPLPRPWRLSTFPGALRGLPATEAWVAGRDGAEQSQSALTSPLHPAPPLPGPVSSSVHPPEAFHAWRLLAQPSSSASTEPRNAVAFSYGAPTAYAECSGRSETRARGPRWEGGFRAASGAGPEGPRLGPGRLVPARAPSRGQHVLSRGSGTAGPSTRHLGPFLLFHGINIAP